MIAVLTLETVGSTVVYGGLGIGMFILGFWIVDWLTPYDLWKELVEKQNSALAIALGFAALGLCIIIAAAIT